MPKSSTFYAGCERRLGRHVFLELQHNQKSWKAGQFTVNVILSAVVGAPATLRLGARKEFDERAEGSYRIGSLLHRKDKWWCLAPTEPSRLALAWRPSAYGDERLVFDEAIVDLTEDVKRLCSELALPR